MRLRVLIALTGIMLLTSSFAMGADKDREQTKAKQTAASQAPQPNHPAKIKALDVTCGGDSGNVCDDYSNYVSPFDSCPNLVCVRAGTDQYGYPIYECSCL